MSYQEREISVEALEKHLRVLDSDEGIRIENEPEHAYINRTSRRYCVNIARDGKDEFFYMTEPGEVLDFISKKIGPLTKIFAY
ncbi:MAG TPA: hypothetical protein VJ792_08450 [Candidatus Nitrosotalea sp.]|nr:hypothetical protein [Candidatus Nitrosotalea sp.]